VPRESRKYYWSSTDISFEFYILARRCERLKVYGVTATILFYVILYNGLEFAIKLYDIAKNPVALQVIQFINCEILLICDDKESNTNYCESLNCDILVNRVKIVDQLMKIIKKGSPF